MATHARAMLALAALLLCASFCVAAPVFVEKFDAGWDSRWVHSDDAKYAGKFEVEAPSEFADDALKVPEKARHYGIATKLPTAVDPAEGLALQYEIKFTDGLSCGGAYLKFVTADESFSPAGLKDDTPYTVMFGPDKCGATNKVHLIFRHKNPVTGTIEEKHLKAPPSVVIDDKTHVYTAVIKPDNTYAVLVDGVEKKAGSLFDDFEAPFLPPAEIPDPEDTKPEDWVDEARIADPDATKPDDWDEDAPRMIPDEEAEKPEGWLDDEPDEVPDPDAEKPEDWDEEEDGEWEAPTIPNPKCKAAPGCGEWQRPTKANPDYKGKWSAPMIDNPAYKGPWAPRDIPNPEFHEDREPLKRVGQVGGVAIEIWTMDKGYYFDNVVVANDEESVTEVREAYWKPKHDKEVEAAKAKAEAAAKEAEAASGKADDPVVGALKKLLDHPALAQYKGHAAGAVQYFEKQPYALYALLASPLVLGLILLLALGGRKKKTDAVGAAKKEDAPSADDVAPSATAAAGSSEITAEAAAEEEEEPGVRRRTRRET